MKVPKSAGLKMFWLKGAFFPASFLVCKRSGLLLNVVS